jgi:hypothetical protein
MAPPPPVEARGLGGVTAGNSSNEMEDTQDEEVDEADGVSGMVLGGRAVANLIGAATGGGGPFVCCACTGSRFQAAPGSVLFSRKKIFVSRYKSLCLHHFICFNIMAIFL